MTHDIRNYLNVINESQDLTEKGLINRIAKKAAIAVGSKIPGVKGAVQKSNTVKSQKIFKGLVNSYKKFKKVRDPKTNEFPPKGMAGLKRFLSIIGITDKQIEIIAKEQNKVADELANESMNEDAFDKMLSGSWKNEKDALDDVSAFLVSSDPAVSKPILNRIVAVLKGDMHGGQTDKQSDNVNNGRKTANKSGEITDEQKNALEQLKKATKNDPKVLTAILQAALKNT